MRNAPRVFAPLIGKLAWSVGLGHGSFLTMQFGAPKLVVREPITDGSKALKRRRVHLLGAWELWVMDATWKVTCRRRVAKDDSVDNIKIGRTLIDLDGQRLIAVTRGRSEGSIKLAFDLGGEMRLGPRAGAESKDVQWRLSRRGGKTIDYLMDGEISEHKS